MRANVTESEVTSAKGLQEGAAMLKKSGKGRHGREMTDSAAEIERPIPAAHDTGGLIVMVPDLDGVSRSLLPDVNAIPGTHFIWSACLQKGVPVVEYNNNKVIFIYHQYKLMRSLMLMCS